MRRRMTEERLGDVLGRLGDRPTGPLVRKAEGQQRSRVALWCFSGTTSGALVLALVVIFMTPSTPPGGPVEPVALSPTVARATDLIEYAQSERAEYQPEMHGAAIRSLTDGNAFVERAALFAIERRGVDAPISAVCSVLRRCSGTLDVPVPTELAAGTDGAVYALLADADATACMTLDVLWTLCSKGRRLPDHALIESFTIGRPEEVRLYAYRVLRADTSYEPSDALLRRLAGETARIREAITWPSERTER